MHLTPTMDRLRDKALAHRSKTGRWPLKFTISKAEAEAIKDESEKYLRMFTDEDYKAPKGTIALFMGIPVEVALD